MYTRVINGRLISVSKCDRAILDNYSWSPKTNKGKTYVERHTLLSDYPVGGWVETTTSLHRQIRGLMPGDKQHVDHKDGNGLNNTRSNIRLCSSQNNAQNRSKRKGTSSRYKGVSFHKKLQRWQAYICKDYKLQTIGWYDIEADAAKAYNKVAKKMFGAFAKLNVFD